MCNELCFLIVLFGLVADLAFDKRTHRKLFEGEIEFERFYRYLQYAALNTFIHMAEVFWDEMIELLDDENQPKAAEWFNDAVTKKEGHWMLAHSGQGFSNTNCSLEVHCRTLKWGVPGSSGKAGGGYSPLRKRSNLTFIKNNSKPSLADMVEKGQSVSFAKIRMYNKGRYDKLQEFSGAFLVVCESMDPADLAFKNLRRVMAACEGATLYAKLTNARKDQRESHTIREGKDG